MPIALLERISTPHQTFGRKERSQENHDYHTVVVYCEWNLLLANKLEKAVTV